ncbi:SAM-dependent methyltransferase [Streptomyces paludis]|uniref:SAM-dependent methyltransferase n=1 Tax=Streptomyces paludis TaxID=2282738 RepID=A0A345HIE2_9ACTN|nr:SAM-dependent methyltransferase [Streptomyces paludis]AXG76466.1 SAM-dependent methyltransferase [Streptomyces paludis]
MDDGAVDLELDRAHSARMYDYYLGGTTNFPADREAGDRTVAAFPHAPTAARINRRFMHRSVRRLAAAGLTQFLDIGTGIPTSPNLHEIAQREVPHARVVYSDNDPIVLAHARALLRSGPEGRTAYVHGDITAPEALLAADQVRATLDFTRPIALSLNALLHFVPDDDAAHAVVGHLKDALPSGSTLAIAHGTAEFDPEGMARVVATYRAAGTVVRPRERAEIERFFTGWELLAPGVVCSHRWRPDRGDGSEHLTAAEASSYAGVARKP